MDCYPLEDWKTIKAHAAADVVTQSEPRWLDLSGYRELVVWLDVREFSASADISLKLQTAPAKEDVLFTTMATFSGASLVSGVSTQLVAPETLATGTYPLARWVRWSITFNNAADLTFRIWIAANKPGRQANAGQSVARR